MRHLSPILLLAALLAVSLCDRASAGTCRKDWDNHCTAHQQCCSTNCWRGRPDWKFGVCKPLEEVGEENGNGNDGGGSVIDEPANSGGGNSARTCRKDWDNHCTAHQQCCSTNCWRGRPDWRYGVCKPLEESGEEGDGNADGSVTGGGSGADEEGSSRGCRKNLDNHCTRHQQCCSGNCWRGRPEWKYGVCKPLEEVGEVGEVGGGNDDGNDGSVTGSPATSEPDSSSEDSTGLTSPARPFED